MHLKDDVEWAEIRERNGKVTSHPVEWMLSYAAPTPAISNDATVPERKN